MQKKKKIYTEKRIQQILTQALYLNFEGKEFLKKRDFFIIWQELHEAN